MSLLAGTEVTLVKFSGKMKDNLDSTEKYLILYMGEHGGEVIMFMCI